MELTEDSERGRRRYSEISLRRHLYGTGKEAQDSARRRSLRSGLALEAMIIRECAASLLIRKLKSVVISRVITVS